VESFMLVLKSAHKAPFLVQHVLLYCGKMYVVLNRSVCDVLCGRHEQNWGSPKVGSLCAAKYSEDGNWYRGRIIRMHSAHEVSNTSNFFYHI